MIYQAILKTLGGNLYNHREECLETSNDLSQQTLQDGPTLTPINTQILKLTTDQDDREKYTNEIATYIKQQKLDCI